MNSHKSEECQGPDVRQHGSIINILRVFLPFACGYFLSYLYRVVNAVIAPDLAGDLSLAPANLGLLTAVYFITFASFQIPLGILLDRYGPRRVESTLLLFAGLGAYIFSLSTSLTGLVIGRAFIGFGVSSCLMAAFKAYTLWFPKEKWPIVNGFQMAAGGLGALAATSPVEFALGYTDWRGVFFALSLATFVAAAAVFFIVPEKKSATCNDTIAQQFEGLKAIATSRTFWALAPLTTTSQTAFLSIQGLWSGPWLTSVAGLSRNEVADTLFLVALAMIAGFISIGWLTQWLARRKISATTTAVWGMAIFMVAQLLVLICPVEYTVFNWIIFGFTGTTGIIAYAALSQSFPATLSGRVTTAINLLVFVTAFCMQWLMGAIIDLFTQDQATELAASGFYWSFSLLLILQLFGLLSFWLMSRKAIDVT
ncbi:MFS transporter [Desulforhopalus sp. IMCC35007]|uniref:MFS transporter n=1 Tax=Desulforhopalus sp. IMCC35007 TaxID=2569543 RepID=UPI0010AE9749|nr:MFS transporter [Desulforhopalus sp. IMCC35007]TKB10659.1 MFS transporter [Desulforhopalus sp. IMCC35007]